MEATILSYRRGRKTQTTNQAILKIESIETKENAEKLVGKEVVYETETKKEIKGKITSVHGRNGKVRALFEKGLPGQAITQKVKVL
ncbi:MAG: 50S ribosomal protein L35ae [Candidatus Woesearchaeota archaeon]